MEREKYLVCIKRSLVSPWECVAVCSLFRLASDLCNGLIDTYADAGIIASGDAGILGVVAANPSPCGWDAMQRQLEAQNA